MLALAGFIMILIMIVLLTKYKIWPAGVFSILPIIMALILGNGFDETMSMAGGGITKVMPTATLFIGSITFFGIMDDVGLFDGVVKWMVSKVRNSIYSVLAITAIVAIIAHLDGSGTTTYLITIPALFPVVKAMRIRTLPFYFTISLVIGTMNMLPWAGPQGRAATVIGSDPVTLWKAMLPCQIAGFVILIFMVWFTAREEIKKGYFMENASFAVTTRQYTEEEKALKRPKLVWFNFGLTIGVLVLMLIGVPSHLPFLLGVGLALVVNYGKDGTKAQTGRIKAHAKDILPIIFTILCAGIFLGVLSGSGMIEAMSEVLIASIPVSLGRFLHVIMGILSIPLSIVFDADSKIYGILPVLIQVGSNYGVSPVQAAIAMCIGHNMGVAMCMTSATVYFGLGLYGLEYGEAFKYQFPRRMLIGTLIILSGVVLGVL